jgi:UDP-N-acetylmuramate-alanine ligase
MSALARYFRFHGKEVSGYDKTATTLTRQLDNEGIPFTMKTIRQRRRRMQTLSSIRPPCQKIIGN